MLTRRKRDATLLIFDCVYTRHNKLNQTAERITRARVREGEGSLPSDHRRRFEATKVRSIEVDLDVIHNEMDRIDGFSNVELQLLG